MWRKWRIKYLKNEPPVKICPFIHIGSFLIIGVLMFQNAEAQGTDLQGFNLRQFVSEFAMRTGISIQ
jgi:hypothetical protein